MKKLLAFLITLAMLSAMLVPVAAQQVSITNLFNSKTAFAGYVNASNQEKPSTSHYSTDHITVTTGDVVTFGPANPSQDFHLHGFNSAKNISDSTVRADRLEMVDSFGSYCIYAYTVPAGVTSVRIANASAVNDIFTVTVNQKFDTEAFVAYWEAPERAATFAKFGTYFEPKTTSVLYQKSALFVGDSNVDIQTAKHSGIASCGVLWGFRTREELEGEGADHIAQTPDELLNLILPQG